MREPKCHNDILSAVGAQDGSSHSSYIPADILNFLVNCVFLISFGEYGEDDHDDSAFSGTLCFKAGILSLSAH